MIGRWFSHERTENRRAGAAPYYESIPEEYLSDDDEPDEEETTEQVPHAAYYINGVSPEETEAAFNEIVRIMTAE